MIERNIGQEVENKLPDECKGIVDLLNENWGKDKEHNYYHAKNNIITLLENDYHNCINNMSESNIIELFGYPSEKDKVVLTYKLNEECFRMTANTTCNGIQFMIDPLTGKVVTYWAKPLGILAH
jgi:hypothetical protein